MSKSITVGSVMCKYYIEDDQLKVVEGVLVTRAGKKWVEFGSKTVPDEKFPGHRNVERVWLGGKILWLPERDDALAKKLFTEYYVNIIKDLQKQIDEVGDTITMIRAVKVRLGSSKKLSKCFGGDNNEQPEWKRTCQENWDYSNIENIDEYAENKINMLKREMFINLSKEDELHLKTLKSFTAIDAAVRGMINKYWPV